MLKYRLPGVLPHPKYVKAIRGKRKASRISRAGAYIKPLLTQYALAAIKAKKRHPEIFNRCSNLKKRRGTRKPSSLSLENSSSLFTLCSRK